MAYNRTLFSHGFKISSLKHPNDHLQYTYFVRAPRYRVIVFKGGGGRAWVYQHCLHMFKKNGLLEHVKEYGGSSAGALFAVLSAMPLKRGERERIIEELKFHHDILDDSFGSKIYRIITAPLYLISTPLSWIANTFLYAAKKSCNLPGGSLLAFPLNIISGLIQSLSLLTHPKCAAVIYNVVIKKGLFHGKELQQYIKLALHDGTQLSIERFLNHIEDPNTKERIINKLLNMQDLISSITKDINTHQIKVKLATHDITFEHFHRLAAIKELGFKDVFLTATRCQETVEGRLAIFNYKNTPQKPIHLAVRMSMSIPFLYRPVYDDGMYYMDGGCADNFPIRHASPRRYANNFEKDYLRGTYKQDLDVLGVRIEYAEDLGFFHHPTRMISSFWEKIKTRAQEIVFNLVCGMDIVTPESRTRHAIKKKYPLRILQLYDHDVGVTEVGIDRTRKHKILQCEEKRIQEFINAHNPGLTHIENHESFFHHKLNPTKNSMSRKQQKKFLRFLFNEAIPNENIFSSDFSEEEAAECRQQLINKLTVNLKGKQFQREQARAERSAKRSGVFC